MADLIGVDTVTGYGVIEGLRFPLNDIIVEGIVLDGIGDTEIIKLSSDELYYSILEYAKSYQHVKNMEKI